MNDKRVKNWIVLKADGRQSAIPKSFLGQIKEIDRKIPFVTKHYSIDACDNNLDVLSAVSTKASNLE